MTDSDPTDRPGLGALLFSLVVTGLTVAALWWAEWKRGKRA